MWLTEGKKMNICIFVLTECMQERDRHTGRQTDGHRMTAKAALAQHRAAKNGNKTAKNNVKNFYESLATVVRAQNDTTKTANITYTIFDRTLVQPLQATAF